MGLRPFCGERAEVTRLGFFGAAGNGYEFVYLTRTQAAERRVCADRMYDIPFVINSERFQLCTKLRPPDCESLSNLQSSILSCSSYEAIIKSEKVKGFMRCVGI